MPGDGTAGLARSAARGISRLPSAPARRIAGTLLRCGAGMWSTWLCCLPAGRGSFSNVRVDVVSKEYPPEVYGGAGVHVAELVRALRRIDGLETRGHALRGA